MISEANALKDQVAKALDHYGNNDDYKDWGMGGIVTSEIIGALIERKWQAQVF